VAALLCAAAVIAAVAGCAGGGAMSPPSAAPADYVVKPDDTLFAIARRFGLDHRDIARWNRLGDGSLIYPGQRLRLSPAAGAALPARAAGAAGADDGPPVAAWRWPTAGEVVARFGQSHKAVTGILIAGRPGQPIEAAAAGEVVYAGSGLTGYGQLVILKHNASWLSAYGHNQELLVREGERVRAGQQIATMGAGAGRDAVLHFEIRRNGSALDPLPLLANERH
jgi:lipoprotein NlpD